MERKPDANLGRGEEFSANEKLNLKFSTLAQNLKTRYLSSRSKQCDVINLVELVSRFIETAEENLTDILSDAPPTSKPRPPTPTTTTNSIPEFKKPLLLPNLLRATTSFLEDGLNHENSIVRLKIKQILLKEFKTDIPSTDRIAKCLHLYLANVATLIYFPFRTQINQWLEKQQKGRSNLAMVAGAGAGAGNRTGQISDFDAIVNYIVKRYFKKLQKFENINATEVMRQFVGGANTNTGRLIDIGKLSRDWNWSSSCLSGQDSEFRKIFLKPVPDLFFSEEQIIDNENEKILYNLQTRSRHDLNKKSKKLTRPPFEFELEELTQKTKNLPAPRIPTPKTTTNDKYYVYEDPLPLAIQIIEDRKVQLQILKYERQKKLCSQILDVCLVQVRELESRISQKLGMTDFIRRIQDSGPGPFQNPAGTGTNQIQIHKTQSPAQRIMKLSGEIDSFAKTFKKFGNSGNLSVMKKCLEIIFDKIESQNKTAGIGKDALELLHIISFLATDLITGDVCTRFYYNTLLDKDPNREINSKPKKEKVKHFEKLLGILTKTNLISTSVDLLEADSDTEAKWFMNRKISVNSLIQKTTREIFHEKKTTSPNLLKYFCSSLKCDNEIDNILYNEHLTSIADCLLLTGKNCPSDEISLTTCVITSKISTEEPVRITQNLINKLQSFYQEINIHKERKEEIRILEITLNLLQVNGSKVVCVNKIEDLIGSVVSSMGMYANNIYLQFVGCSTLKHLLCDHPMRSLISCEIGKDAFRTSLECLLDLLAKLQSVSVSVNGELNAWILLFKNIFESYITSENLFLAESPGDTVKLLLTKYTSNLDSNSDYSFWAGLYSAMYGSINLPGVDSSHTVAEAENSFDQNNGISIITNKLDVLTQTYLKFPRQNRNIFGLIIRLSSKYDFAKKLGKYSGDFMISLRACIHTFYNVETSASTSQEDNVGVGNSNDSRTALKLAIISYALLSVLIQNPPRNSRNYSAPQRSAAVQKIARLEESGICFSSGCDYCAEHSRECVLSLLNTFLKIVQEDPLIASEREVNAAKFCIFMCKPLVQQQQKSFSSVQLNVSESEEAKSTSITKYYTQKSEPSPMTLTSSPKYAQEKGRVKLVNDVEGNKTEVEVLANWIAQFLKVSSSNLNVPSPSLVRSLSEGNFNLSEWEPNNVTYLVAITVSKILDQSSCDEEKNSHCRTRTELCFAFNALSSIKWFYYRHNMKIHPIHKFLVHLGLQYYSIFSQFHYSDSENNLHSSNQTAEFRRSRWNFIQRASKQMDNFYGDKYEENILAVRLGGLAIYRATQII